MGRRALAKAALGVIILAAAAPARAEDRHPGGRNQPPVASFTVSPAAPVAGQQVTFASTSSDPEGKPISTAWDLNGDGRFGDAMTPAAARSFAAPGSYTVGLRVRDEKGATSTAIKTVTVTAPAPPVVEALVRIRGSATRGGAKIKLFTVTTPAGAQVNVACREGSCARHRVAMSRTAAATQATTVFHFRSLERKLRKGTRIEVRVTAPGQVGKYTLLVIRSLKPPRRTDACLPPGGTTPTPCPST